jgi:hypothetical protein
VGFAVVIRHLVDDGFEDLGRKGFRHCRYCSGGDSERSDLDEFPEIRDSCDESCDKQSVRRLRRGRRPGEQNVSMANSSDEGSVNILSSVRLGFYCRTRCDSLTDIVRKEGQGYGLELIGEVLQKEATGLLYFNVDPSRTRFDAMPQQFSRRSQH